MKKLDWSQNRSWKPCWAAHLGAGGLSGHTEKPKGLAAKPREVFWGLLEHFGARVSS